MKLNFYLDRKGNKEESKSYLLIARVNIPIGKRGNKYDYYHFVFSTKLSMTADMFERVKVAKKSSKESKDKDVSYVVAELRRIERTYNDIQLNCKLNKLDLKAELAKEFRKEAVKELNLDVIKWVESFLEKDQTLTENTKSGYRNIVSNLKKFQAFKFKNSKTLEFHHLTREFFVNFESFLLNESKLSNNSLKVTMDRLKSICRKAMDEGIEMSNGFEKYKSKLKNYDRDHLIALSHEQLESLIAFNCKTESHQKVKDVFVFMCLTGLRESDSKRVSFENIKDSKFLEIATKKTGKAVRIELCDTALTILKKYGYKLPNLTNTYLNKTIKVIASQLDCFQQSIVVAKRKGSELNETTKTYAESIGQHTARRTFGTLAYKNGKPLQEIAKILGHSKISQTEEYLRLGL